MTDHQAGPSKQPAACPSTVMCEQQADRSWSTRCLQLFQRWHSPCLYVLAAFFFLESQKI